MRQSPTRYLYVLPALALVGVFIYYGIVYNAFASLTRWDGVSAQRQHIGLRNFWLLYHDPEFLAAVRHTLLFGAVTISAQALLGFVLAWLVSKRIVLSSLYKTIFFAPVVMAPAVIAPVATEMLAPDGQVNHFLDTIGLHRLNHEWLADPHWALYSLMVVNIWEWTGFSFFLYYAALGQIDPEIYQAARIDGAGEWRTMWRIAWPLCRPTTFTLVILGAISSVKVFDLVFLITGGGPAGSTDVVTTYIYRESVIKFHAGYGAAIAMYMLGAALVLTVFQLRLYRGREHA